MSVQLLKSLSIKEEQHGTPITGTIDLGWVPFHELHSTLPSDHLKMSISHT